MKVLLVGWGVGEALLQSQTSQVDGTMVLADYNVKRAEEVQKLGDTNDFPLSSLMPVNRRVSKSWQKIQVDLIMNSVDPISINKYLMRLTMSAQRT